MEAKLPRTGVGWQERLSTADTIAAVANIARDFLAQFDPYELHALPRASRPPPKIVDSDDVTAYALDLARQPYDAEHAAIMQKLIGFFSSAAARLAQVSAAPRSLASGE